MKFFFILINRPKYPKMCHLAIMGFSKRDHATVSIQGSRSYGHFLHLDPKWCTMFQLKLSDGGMRNLESSTNLRSFFITDC